MNPVSRMVLELSALARTVDAAVYANYIAAAARRTLSILRERKLVPADNAMTGSIRVCHSGRHFIVPLSDMDRLLPGGDSRTFSGVREMYARNVYLRNAPNGIQLDTVIDVGANRGMFALLATAGLGASVAALVEAQPLYVPIWNVWRKANGLDVSRFRDFPLRCSDIDDAGSVSLNRVLDALPTGRCDLLKMDIEGGEAAVFSRNTEWLSRVRYITAEVHNHVVDTSCVFSALRRNKFQVQGYDDFGDPVSDELATYLFASALA